MPSKIRVLDERTINKIAAGEVIENSASCVKELVENALDAKAKKIEVEILAGGRNKISVCDDGLGMNADDALLSLQRHATSKLSQIEDMQTLVSMGFRGEALASMGSVSKLTLKTSEGDQGFEVHCFGGKLTYSGVCAHKKGTTIELKSLFYNVPARRAFQKSIQQDIQDVQKCLMQLSLAYPSVSFRLTSDHEVLWQTQGAFQKPFEEIAQRLKKFYPKELTEHLIPIDFQEGPLEIKGWLGPLAQTRPNRTGQLFFLNHRCIQSKLLSFAVEAGYGTRLAPKRFPFAFLFLSIDPKWVDVNVHPQKKEVRFSHPFELKDGVTKAVDQALSQKLLVAQLPRETDFEVETLAIETKPLLSKPFFKPLEHSKIQTRSMPLSTKKEPWIVLPHLIGFYDRYFFVEAKSCQEVLALPHKALDGILLIDQRRAKERILYDYLLESKQSEIEMQQLLFAQTLEFSLAESLLLKHYQEGLNRLGVGIRPLTGNTFLIDALPAQLEVSDVKAILLKILEDLEIFGMDVSLEEEVQKKCALAMTKAIQFEKKIEGHEQAIALLQKLFQTKEPWISPKGKAIIKCWDQDDLSKLFNRTEK